MALVYAGGTLGMVRSERGFAPSPHLRELLEAKIPELGSSPLPEFDLIDFGDPADSSDFTPETWYQLALLIRDQATRYDGIVVIHGTDTMAYTASALSFLMNGKAIPVILTGSQLPLGELRSDARTNLLTALEVAASGQVRESAICFGQGVVRGNRATKVQSAAFDAFTSPNFPLLASVGADVHYHHVPESPASPWTCTDAIGHRPVEIVILPIYPGLVASTVRAVAQASPWAVVLECYGMGTFPSRNRELLAAVGSLVGTGSVVVARSQCLVGKVELERYAAGRSLADCGVVSGLEMTREALYTKLHVLHALHLSGPEVVDYLSKNLCGELTEERSD